MESSIKYQKLSFNFIQVVLHIVIILVIVARVSSIPTSYSLKKDKFGRLRYSADQDQSYCGRLITDRNEPIELLSTNEDNYWEKFQTHTKSHEYDKVTKVQLLTDNAVVRLCNGYDNKCTTYETDQEIAMDVKYIFSAACSIKKESCVNPKNCGSVILEENECARFYQDKDCNSCVFKSYGMTKNASELKFSYQVIGSVAVNPKCEAWGSYFDNNNIALFNISKSDNIEAESIKTHTTFTCSK